MGNSTFLIQKKSQKMRRSYESIKDKLDIIKEAILKYVPAEKIYLFGSYAYGKPNKNSDIDVYAVIPDKFRNNINSILGEIANYLFNFEILNLDLFLVETHRFNYYLTYSSFEKTICNKGILLYGD